MLYLNYHFIIKNTNEQPIKHVSGVKIPSTGASVPVELSAHSSQHQDMLTNPEDFGSCTLGISMKAALHTHD